MILDLQNRPTCVSVAQYMRNEFCMWRNVFCIWRKILYMITQRMITPHTTSLVQGTVALSGNVVSFHAFHRSLFVYFMYTCNESDAMYNGHEQRRGLFSYINARLFSYTSLVSFRVFHVYVQRV